MPLVNSAFSSKARESIMNAAKSVNMGEIKATRILGTLVSIYISVEVIPTDSNNSVSRDFCGIGALSFYSAVDVFTMGY